MRNRSHVMTLVLAAAIAVSLTLGKAPSGPTLLNLLLVFALMPLLVVIHESGHALMGSIVGLRLFWVSIGVGRKLFEFRLRGVRITVNALPLMGLTALAPKNTRRMRMRLFLAIIAGPATHLILAALATAHVLGSRPEESSLSLLFLDITPVKVFILVNVVFLVLSLIPRRSGSPAGIVRTDGSTLLRLAMNDERILNEYRSANSMWEAYELQHEARFEEAIEYYERALQLQPSNWLLQHDLAVAQVMSGDAIKARESLVSLLDTEMGQSEHYLLLINNIAYVDALITNGDDEYLVEAEAYSSEVLAKAPKVAAFLGTRGSVLVQNGELDEGLRHLKTSYRHGSNSIARGTSACWIAIGMARGGHRDEGRKWLGRARRDCPQLTLIARAEEEFETAA